MTWSTSPQTSKEHYLHIHENKKHYPKWLKATLHCDGTSGQLWQAEWRTLVDDIVVSSTPHKLDVKQFSEAKLLVMGCERVAKPCGSCGGPVCIVRVHLRSRFRALCSAQDEAPNASCAYTRV